MSKYQIKDDGVYRAGTLAQLLDKREIAIGEPTKENLPDTINPLQFVFTNLLVNNCGIVRIKQSAMQTSNEYLKLLSNLSYVLPPEKSMLVVLYTDTVKDKFIINQNNTDTVTFCTVTTAPTDLIVNNVAEKVTLSLTQRDCNE